MSRPQRFYTAGNLVGQPIQEYPKMLKRGAERLTVRNEAEHDAAEAEGWSEKSAPAPIRAPDAIVPEDMEEGEEISDVDDGEADDEAEDAAEDSADEEADGPPAPFVKKGPARRRRR